MLVSFLSCFYMEKAFLTVGRMASRRWFLKKAIRKSRSRHIYSANCFAVQFRRETRPGQSRWWERVLGYKGCSLLLYSETEGWSFQSERWTGSSYSAFRPQYLANCSQSLFPRNPPPHQHGLQPLCLEVHPKFHCAETNVICLCQVSHSRLYQWPACSVSM